MPRRDEYNLLSGIGATTMCLNIYLHIQIYYRSGKSMSLDEMVLSYLGGINHTDLVN